MTDSLASGARSLLSFFCLFPARQCLDASMLLPRAPPKHRARGAVQVTFPQGEHQQAPGSRATLRLSHRHEAQAVGETCARRASGGRAQPPQGEQKRPASHSKGGGAHGLRLQGRAGGPGRGGPTGHAQWPDVCVEKRSGPRPGGLGAPILDATAASERAGEGRL